MKQKKLFKTLAMLLALSVIILSSTGCSDALSFLTEPSLIGEWDAGYGTTWTFSSDSTFAEDDSSAWDWDYSGDIVKYSNITYNDESENPDDADNYGYLLIKYTAHVDSAYVDTYSVIRWYNLQTVDGVTTVEYSEGYLYGADKITDPDEALATITEANGYFSYFSTLTLSE